MKQIHSKIVQKPEVINMKRLIISLLVCLIVVGASYSHALAKENALSLNATASSSWNNYSSYGASKAIDGNTYTYWIGYNNSSPWWIQFDTGAVQQVDNIYIQWYSYSYYLSDNYDIQISDDGTNWTNVHTGLQASADETREINQETRYIRLYIHSVPGYSTSYRYPILREFKAYQNAFTPSSMRFQGKLKDSQGAPLDGTYTITFSLYDEESGTNDALWTEDQTLTITNGLLDVELGSVTPIELSFNEQYWLGVKVESDPEMTPRFKLTSVPYAFVSEE